MCFFSAADSTQNGVCAVCFDSSPVRGHHGIACLTCFLSEIICRMRWYMNFHLAPAVRSKFPNAQFLYLSRLLRRPPVLHKHSKYLETKTKKAHSQLACYIHSLSPYPQLKV